MLLLYLPFCFCWLVVLDVTFEIIVLRVYKFSILSHQIDLNRAAVVIFYHHTIYIQRNENILVYIVDAAFFILLLKTMCLRKPNKFTELRRPNDNTLLIVEIVISNIHTYKYNCDLFQWSKCWFIHMVFTQRMRLRFVFYLLILENFPFI